MPQGSQGVCNGPSTFQRMGNSCFQELIYTRQCLQLYLDDLMAHTATIEDHFDVLRTIFRICRGTYCAYTTAYHPQANGQTERMNRTLLGLLRKFCSNYPEHWPKYLDILNFSYNNSTSPQTGYSPHMVILGRHLELPLWLLPDSSLPPDLDAYMHNTLTKQREVHKYASEYLVRAAARNVCSPF